MPAHLGFIVAAFVITGLVLLGTVAAILADYRAQLRALARLSSLAGPRASPEATAGRRADDGH